MLDKAGRRLAYHDRYLKLSLDTHRTRPACDYGTVHSALDKAAKAGGLNMESLKAAHEELTSEVRKS